MTVDAAFENDPSAPVPLHMANEEGELEPVWLIQAFDVRPEGAEIAAGGPESPTERQEAPEQGKCFEIL